MKTILEGNLNTIIDYQMESLHHVQLLNCDFESIDAKTFVGLKNLVEICLSNNKLKSLDSGIFADQTNLAHLT